MPKITGDNIEFCSRDEVMKYWMLFACADPDVMFIPQCPYSYLEVRDAMIRFERLDDLEAQDG